MEVMDMRNVQLVLICAALACVLCTATVSATSFSGIEYEANIYGVTSDFNYAQSPTGNLDVNEIREPPDYKMVIPGQGDERIVRYPLVGLIDMQVAVVLRGFETSRPVAYETDLENIQITLNGEPIPVGEPIPAERGTLRISGTISSSRSVGNKIRMIKFDDLHEEDEKNTKLTVYAGTPDMLKAAKMIYDTYEEYRAKGGTVLPEHFAGAVKAYQSGNYDQVETNLQFAEQESASYDRGYRDGLIFGVGITAVLMAILVFVVARLRGKSVARAKEEQYYRPHLYSLNTVIMRYYEHKENKKPIPAKYEAVLKRAFDYEPNASRDIKRYKPSLFQVLYMTQKDGGYEKVSAKDINEVYEKAINILLEGLPADNEGEDSAKPDPGFFAGLSVRLRRTDTGR